MCVSTIRIIGASQFTLMIHRSLSASTTDQKTVDTSTQKAAALGRSIMSRKYAPSTSLQTYLYDDDKDRKHQMCNPIQQTPNIQKSCMDPALQKPYPLPSIS